MKAELEARQKRKEEKERKKREAEEAKAAKKREVEEAKAKAEQAKREREEAKKKLRREKYAGVFKAGEVGGRVAKFAAQRGVEAGKKIGGIVKEDVERSRAERTKARRESKRAPAPVMPSKVKVVRVQPAVGPVRILIEPVTNGTPRLIETSKTSFAVSNARPLGVIPKGSVTLPKGITLKKSGRGDYYIGGGKISRHPFKGSKAKRGRLI